LLESFCCVLLFDYGVVVICIGHRDVRHVTCDG
jgi:hypothetical protein